MMKQMAVVLGLCWWVVTVPSVLALGTGYYVSWKDWNQMNSQERAAYLSGFMETTQGLSRQAKSAGAFGVGEPVSDRIRGLDDSSVGTSKGLKSMTDTEKVARGNGVADAERTARIQEALAWKGVEVSTVVKALDDYYADSRRRGLPVSLALVFLYGEVSGADNRRAQELTN